MNKARTGTLISYVALAAMMAASRFEHFGSPVLLPDASLAVFFLGGLYISGAARASVAAFAALILEAGLIDYAVAVNEGFSGWLVSPAYWFMIPTYASLWLAGRWFSARHSLRGLKLIGLGAVAWAGCSFAFVLSNAGMYLFSGIQPGMHASEFASSVAQYYVPYVSFALLYIASIVAIHMVWHVATGKRMRTGMQHSPG